VYFLTLVLTFVLLSQIRSAQTQELAARHPAHVAAFQVLLIYLSISIL